MRGKIKRIIHPFLKWRYNWRQRKPRNFTYKDISVMVYPKVFSPESTISTEIFIDFIETLDLTNKTVLELGAGSGLISFFSISKGAKVTASDISRPAIDGLRLNTSALNVDLEIVDSDLFENLHASFDYIFINPPYYPKNPKTIADKAWFCGERFEYFDALFDQLKLRQMDEETVYLILSQDCDLEQINRISLKHYLQLNLIHQHTKWNEENFIFQVVEY